MSQKRMIVILVLIGLISGLSGILGNVASEVLPEVWQPYLWLAWPLFFVFTIAGIGLAIWQIRAEQRTSPQSQSDELPRWVSQLAEAIRRAGQPEPSEPPPAKPALKPPPPHPAADEDFLYDVFISYSHADQAWVRGELLLRLEAAGLKVCIDLRDFQPGAPSVTEMERAVVSSHKTLLILTPAYLESAWTDFEALMLQTLDPANRARRLIPLLKTECGLPPRISYLTYVDFTEPEELEVAWTQLLTALGAPPVQEAPEAPTREGWRLAHPYPMPPNFTGRTAERETLSEWLEADPGHPLLAVRALGGFGKSALAWHWLLHDVDPARWPRVVWWSFYERDASFEGFVQETLTYLGVDPRPLGPRRQAEALLRSLHQPGTLLILDGFERALRAYSGMGAAYQGDEVGRVGCCCS